MTDGGRTVIAFGFALDPFERRTVVLDVMAARANGPYASGLVPIAHVRPVPVERDGE